VPVAARTLAIVLVTLGGVLAGFLSYRHAHPPAATLSVMPMPQAPGAGATADTAGAAAGAAAADATDRADAGGGAPSRPIPDRVPELTLPDLAGQPRSLREFRGHPLIINFWATWCAPCRREMPLLQRLRQSHRGDGLQVVGIAVDFKAAVADYVHRQPVDYPLLIGEDAGLAAAEQFGMQTVLPFSVFADAAGRILAVKVGELHPEEADYILGAMQALAGGRLSLPEAQAGIAQRLRDLAIERAKAGVEDP
jgi:thiol-disulfide isomerase/thioredoxin